ncbi:MAG: tetratricopeptide repeat protein [Longimicrobiales bacterium]|nr:tetratricopeptide repeat protein [Longimicrobiales bacterium]
MKARLGLILATAALFSGTGCAAGGGAVSQGPTAAPTLPGSGGQVLAEGIRPRDNSQTRAAENFLDQGMGAAEDAEKAGFFRQALEAAREGIAFDSENPKSYFQAAVAMVNLGEYLGADSMFTRAEAIHPRYVLETEPWRERGWVDAYNSAIVPLNEGDLEGAAAFFEAANALYSDRPEAFLQLGSVYSRLGRGGESADAFRASMVLLEDSKELAQLDTALASTWQQHWEISTLGLGQALQLSEQYQEAADLFGRLLADDPDNATLIGSLASALTELGQADSVDVLYEQLLTRPGLTEFDYSNAGVGLYTIEKYDRAAEAFRAAADMNPFGRDARLNLTQTYYIAEQWEALIPAARELLILDPLNGLVWIFMTRAYSELDRPEEANAVFGEYQAIGYEVEGIILDVGADGGAGISGNLKNTTAEPGGTVTLRFHFGGQTGREIGTVDFRVQIPAVEEMVEFNGNFSSSEIVTGYKYEVVG